MCVFHAFANVTDSKAVYNRSQSWWFIYDNEQGEVVILAGNKYGNNTVVQLTHSRFIDKHEYLSAVMNIYYMLINKTWNTNPNPDYLTMSKALAANRDAFSSMQLKIHITTEYIHGFFITLWCIQKQPKFYKVKTVDNNGGTFYCNSPLAKNSRRL